MVKKEFTFDECLDFVLSREGGYSNNPKDAGGETKFGISDRRDGVVDGKADLNGDGVGDVAIRGLSREDAAKIYRRDYYDASGCEKIFGAVRLWLFDTAVNCGVAKAVRLIQTAGGTFVDGKLGVKSAMLINSRNQKMLLNRLCDMRISYYRDIVVRKPEQKIFLNGWIDRVEQLRKMA